MRTGSSGFWPRTTRNHQVHDLDLGYVAVQCCPFKEKMQLLLLIVVGLLACDKTCVSANTYEIYDFFVRVMHCIQSIQDNSVARHFTELWHHKRTIHSMIYVVCRGERVKRLCRSFRVITRATNSYSTATSKSDTTRRCCHSANNWKWRSWSS